MEFLVYNEESNVISLSDYLNIRRKIEDNSDNKISRTGAQRKIYFNKDINYLVDVSSREGLNTDRYSINIYDGDFQHMQLDKQSNRDGTIYRQYTYLSAQQYYLLMNGQTDFLHDSDDPLFQDFYLQLTINQLSVGVVVDYKREMYRMGYGQDYLIFDTQISSTYNVDDIDFLSEELLTYPRLEPDKAVMTYRKGMDIPRVIANALHLGENVRRIGSGAQ